jgi:hypothetical protein
LYTIFNVGKTGITGRIETSSALLQQVLVIEKCGEEALKYIIKTISLFPPRILK